MSRVGFEHVFIGARPVVCSPDLNDIRGLLTQDEADGERLFSDVVIDVGLADFDLASAFCWESN